MTLHGRAADLGLVDDTLAALSTRRGRALFLTGEAGIGKSTLLGEARVRAGDQLVLTGAAWESGGAPSYWPWVQVLRDAADQVGVRVATLPGADRIASLVPGWGVPSTEPTSPDAAAARFGLLDAVVRALLALAVERPFVLLLDDLHAADLPTLDLLVMLVRELPRAPIALVAAWREGELAVRSDAAQRLARVMRGGTVQVLRRLTAEEVAQWVGDDARAVFAATEGNPLFVEETLRARRGGAARAMSTVIADHLALVGERTRELLATASVLGRQFDAAQIATLANLGADEIAVGLRDAAAVGIVEARERDWRFRHVLLRDHLYEALQPSRCSELHRRAGALLEATDPARAAHHLLAGVASGDVTRAVETARIAAARATEIYAFEEAAELLDAALRALDGTPHARTALAIDVRIELADARHHVGATELAKAECIKAADLARECNDAERLARAAMVYARELISGTRDPVMIALLDEAQTKLGAHDLPARARVLARLAAALVPGPEAEILRAQQIARDAVAMARRIGDRETMMFALRFAAHAHAYQVPLAAAYAMASEVVELSDQLGRPLEAADHRAWLVGGNLARGDLAAAEAALESFRTLTAPLPQPHYRWRTPILRAAWETRAGNFVEAERHIAISAEIGREYDLDRALWSARFAQLGVIAASRDPARASAFVDEIRSKSVARIGQGAGNFIALVLAIAGRTDEARAELERTVFFPTLVVLQFGVEAMVILRDPSHTARVVTLMEDQTALHPLVHGPQGSIFMRPSAMALGELYALMGRLDDAIAKLEEGLALARALQSPPAIAQGAAPLARLLAQRARGDDRERAVALDAEAVRIARAFGIHGIEASGTASMPSAKPSAKPSAQELSLVCDGDRVRVCWNGRALQIATAKGFEFLAALLAVPGRELHVSDLIGDEDRGDAGEVFDAKARASYRKRAEELQAELEEARDRNDIGRAERLSAELEAVTDELLAGTGLGGRTRKTGSRVERARVNVQRRIKDAIKRLGAEDEALGRYLEATVRTGTFCSFVPLDS